MNLPQGQPQSIEPNRFAQFFGRIEWYPGMTLESVEKELILSCIQKMKNKTLVANHLGICRKTLYSKIRKYGKEDGKLYL
jgi:DNA-binding NtrC family response regulator